MRVLYRTLVMQHDSTMNSTRIPVQTTAASAWYSSGMYDLGGPGVGVGYGVGIDVFDMFAIVGAIDGTMVRLAIVRASGKQPTTLFRPENVCARIPHE